MTDWWLCACAVEFGDLLHLWASHQHLERCQRQLFIKPRVLEPPVYPRKHQHSLISRWVDSSHYVLQHVGWFVLFVSTDCEDGVTWKVCLLRVSPSLEQQLGDSAWKSVRFLGRHLWNMQLGSVPTVSRLFYTLVTIWQIPSQKDGFMKMLTVN